jgi:hypothetical protein
MKRFCLVFCCALFANGIALKPAPIRPHITGIDHVRIYVTNIDDARVFYGLISGISVKGLSSTNSARSSFIMSWGPRTQRLEIEQAPSPAPKNLLAEVAFATSNVPQLVANGSKPKEEPKIGRDGKWQLNLYDPDDTRIEFMEFTPTEKPCCSSYTGRHPTNRETP